MSGGSGGTREERGVAEAPGAPVRVLRSPSAVDAPGAGARRRRRRSRAAVAVTLALLASLAAGCGPSAARPAPGLGPAAAAQAVAGPLAPRRAPVIVASVGADFPTLDPARAGDTASIAAVQLMYEPLFTYPPGGSGLVGLLASSWAWSDGGRRLTVRIDPAAHFADGKPVTAGDVVWSLDRMLSPAEDAPQAVSFEALQGFAAFRSGRTTDLAGVEATSPSTVVFHLTVPQTFFLSLLALPSASVLERSAVRAVQGADPTWWRHHSYGSGPYVLSTWIPGQELVLRRNRDYWRRGRRVGGLLEGPFDRVTFRVVPDPRQQLRLFEEGRIDVVWSGAPSLIAQARAAGLADRVVSAPGLSVVYAGFNVHRSPFNDPRVRLAFNLAIDRPALLRAAGGLGRPAAGILPPGIPGYDASLPPYPHDPRRARSLLAAAGASHMSVPLEYVQGEGGALVRTLRSQLAAVGVSVTLRPLPWKTFYADLAAGRAAFFQTSWLADYPDPQDFVFNLMNTASLGRGDAFDYRNPVLDAVEWHADQLIGHPARRDALYRRIDRMIYRDVPWMPEFYGENVALVQSWLRPAGAGLLVHPPLAPQLDKMWIVPHAPPPPARPVPQTPNPAAPGLPAQVAGRSG